LLLSLSCLPSFPLLPRPPCPTLFPYTTLFRSRPPPQAPARRAPAPAVPGQGWPAARGGDRRSSPGAAGARLPGTSGPAALPVSRDRKSTRLNSSHVKISYAVFCLKKKREDNDV